MKMKTRKFLYALMAGLFLVAVSCESNSTASEDELYEVGVDKTKITKPGK
jgi:ABC-type oligopeptide transport system substrate-binding subunit